MEKSTQHGELESSIRSAKKAHPHHGPRAGERGTLPRWVTSTFARANTSAFARRCPRAPGR